GDNRGLINGGMSGQSLLNLEGRNIFPTADDDVLLAVHDEDVAVIRPNGHVAGMEPSATQGFRRGFRLPPVAFHHTVSAGDDFADGGSVAWNIVIVGVHDADFHSGNGVASGGLPDIAALALPAEARLHGSESESGRSFREAVAGIASAVQHLLHLTDQGG